MKAWPKVMHSIYGINSSRLEYVYKIPFYENQKVFFAHDIINVLLAFVYKYVKIAMKITEDNIVNFYNRIY